MAYQALLIKMKFVVYKEFQLEKLSLEFVRHI